MRRFLLGSIVVAVLAPGLAHAAPAPNSAMSPTIFDVETHFDANELDCPVANDGTLARDPNGVSGLVWPQGSGQRWIHGTGLWLVGFFPGVNARQRSAMADFGGEYTPGPVNAQFTGSDTFFSKPQYRVYKITRDDLAQPGKDWLEWPANQGAPVDSSGHPRLIGDQTLYTTFNDAWRPYHSLIDGRQFPLVAEVHQTVFGTGRAVPLTRVLFVHYEITARQFEWPEFYAAFWVDPDLGYAYDDYAATDSAGAAVIAYDSEPAPGEAPSPAVGVCVLADSLRGGPAWRVSTASAWLMENDPTSYQQALSLVRGRQANGDPWVCGDTSTTHFPFSGDPVTGEGCLDPRSGDKRMLITIGPYDVLRNQTIDFALAIVVGDKTGATSVKENLSALREGFAAARDAWRDSLSKLPPAPAQVSLAPIYPNPSRGATTYALSLPTGVTAGEVQVFDLRGRLVWREMPRAWHGGDYHLEWSGQALAGRPAPAGVYWLRVVTNLGTLTQKVVRLP